MIEDCLETFRIIKNRLSKRFRTIPKFSGSSGKNPAYLETFQAIRKLFRLSRNFPYHPENIQPIRKLSEVFQAIQKFSGSSGKYPTYLETPGYPETFQAIQKLSGSSGKYPAYLETFQAIPKLSRLSRNFPDHPENIQTKGNRSFPV